MYQLLLGVSSLSSITVMHYCKGRDRVGISIDEVNKSFLSSTMHYFSLATFLHSLVVVVQLDVLLTTAFMDCLLFSY